MCFTEQELLQIKVDCRNRDFRPFLFPWPWPWLDLDPITFIYEFGPYPLEIYRCAKMNFLHQGFRKLSYYRHSLHRALTSTGTSIPKTSVWVQLQGLIHGKYVAHYQNDSEFVMSETETATCHTASSTTIVEWTAKKMSTRILSHANIPQVVSTADCKQLQNDGALNFVHFFLDYSVNLYIPRSFAGGQTQT